MRTEFEAEGVYDFDGSALLDELRTVLADCPGIACQLKPRKKKSIVVLVTKEHHCLAAVGI